MFVKSHSHFHTQQVSTPKNVFFCYQYSSNVSNTFTKIFLCKLFSKSREESGRWCCIVTSPLWVKRWSFYDVHFICGFLQNISTSSMVHCSSHKSCNIFDQARSFSERSNAKKDARSYVSDSDSDSDSDIEKRKKVNRSKVQIADRTTD